MAMRAHRTGTITPDVSAPFNPVEVDLSTFPTGDGKPMAENVVNATQMVDLQYALRRLLEAQGRLPAVIGGNQFLYYNPRNRRDNLSPDVYVAFGAGPGGREVWFTWVEGKAPDIVFEITSPSTWRQDLSREPRGKLALYERLGVREYYVHDPVYDPAKAMRPRLQAFARRAGGATLEGVSLLPGGGVWSGLLGAELRPVATPRTEWTPAGTYLRVIDPATGAPIRVAEEVRQDNRAAREQAAALQGRLTEAEQARQAAEERARQAEEALERLRAAHDAPSPDAPSHPSEP